MQRAIAQHVDGRWTELDCRVAQGDLAIILGDEAGALRGLGRGAGQAGSGSSCWGSRADWRSARKTACIC
jgi:hypothetical protein